MCIFLDMLFFICYEPTDLFDINLNHQFPNNDKLNPNEPWSEGESFSYLHNYCFWLENHTLVINLLDDLILRSTGDKLATVK